MHIIISKTKFLKDIASNRCKTPNPYCFTRRSTDFVCARIGVSKKMIGEGRGKKAALWSSTREHFALINGTLTNYHTTTHEALARTEHTQTIDTYVKSSQMEIYNFEILVSSHSGINRPKPQNT